jgi:CheY-like chemotaxis protein
MKERILVVDDDSEVANSLVRLVTTMGYESKASYDGRQAADIAADFMPDMVFIDIGMPGFDGYQTVNRIRAHRECGHAILIALTGRTNPEVRQRAYEHGFDLHVAKPLGLDKLQELLTLLKPAKSESTEKRIHRLSASGLHS